MQYVLMLICLLMNVAVADELQSPMYAGVWIGKIGDANVSVCLADGQGQYFYVKHLKAIQLEKMENDGRKWLEKVRNMNTNDMDVTGIWRIDRVSEFRMDGAWSSPNGTKNLKIQLIKKASLENDHQCEEGFSELIVSSITYKYFPMKFGDIPIRGVKTAAGTAFELTSDAPVHKKINAFIENWIKKQAIESYECELNGGGDWHAQLSPMHMIGNFMVIKDALPDTYCGGAHGFWSITHHTVDMGSGEVVDTWSWIKGGERSAESGMDERPKEKLRKLIEKLNPRNRGDDDCSDLSDAFSVDAPYPSDKGLVFVTNYPHVGRVCEDEIVVNYGMMSEFLSYQGIAAVRMLRH